METKLKSTDRPVALYYIFQSDVLSYTKSGKSNCQLAFSGDWNLINTSIGTIQLKETTEEGDGGTVYESNLSATIPGVDGDTPKTTKALSGRPVVLRIDYREGRSLIVGSQKAKVRLYIDAESSTLTQRTLNATFKNSAPNRWLS